MDPMQTIRTEGAPQAIGPYSQAIRCGAWLFTSGQVALDPKTGQLVSGGIEAEATRALENLRAVLLAAGTDPSKVVKTTVFLVDLGEFQAMNAIYARFFGEARPARSTVQVAALPRGARFEIDAIAMI
jgi:2-iminobutanoate/2-iminopropanoate deaminase